MITVLRSFRFWAALAIGVLLIALFVLSTDLSEIATAFEEATYWYLAPAVVVLFLSFWLRCYRWSVLMRPVAADPAPPPLLLLNHRLHGEQPPSLPRR